MILLQKVCFVLMLTSTGNKQDWDNPSAVSRVYHIGRTEALAVANLHQHIDGGVVKLLSKAVAQRGMSRFFTNEVVARGVFNVAFTSAGGITESWVPALTNAEDQKLAPCFEIFKLCR